MVNGGIVCWSQAERFQRRGVFRAGHTLGQVEVHGRKVPRSMKIYVNETVLDLEALEHFSCRFGGPVIPALCGVGVGIEAEVERGSFGTFEEGGPAFSPTIPVAPQVLGVESDLVPVAAHKQEIERSGFRSAMSTGCSDNFQELKEDGFEDLRGDLEHRKLRVMSDIVE